MSATKVDSQEMTATTDDGNQAPSTMSTIIAVIPSDATENAMTILKNHPSSATADKSTESQEIIDASDLTRDQWIQVLNSSSVLKAWKTRSVGDNVHVNRSPSAALSLKAKPPGSRDDEQVLPEYEIADDTYVDSRVSKSRLERELTLKAFSENGIRAGLSGGTADVGLGFSGGTDWQKEGSTSDQQKTSNTAIHGFYNFPRLVLHLSPDYLDLSPQCKQFFVRYGNDCLDWDKIADTYQIFADRFGTTLFSRLTLGARLCTTEELNSDDQAHISEARKTLESNLTAKVTGASVGIEAGYRRKVGTQRSENQNENTEFSRMTLETQGGNGLLSSSIPDWTASVSSHRYWRTIQQEQPWDLPRFLSELAMDSSRRDQILSLNEYAMLEKQNLNTINITASATPIHLRTPSGTKGSYKFDIRLQVDKPNAIKRVFISQLPWDFAELESAVTFERENLQDGVSFDTFFEDIDTKFFPTCDLFLAVELQPFMKAENPHLPSWHSFLSRTKEGQLDTLDWGNIVENTNIHWELDTCNKHQQRSNSLIQPSLPKAQEATKAEDKIAWLKDIPSPIEPSKSVRDRAKKMLVGNKWHMIFDQSASARSESSNLVSTQMNPRRDI